MRPAARRAAVGLLQQRFGVSERRACRVVGISRSCARYRARSRPDEPALRQRLRVLDRIAAERGVPHAIVLDNGPELTGRALDQ